MAEISILDGYAADALELIPRFETLSTVQILKPVMDLLPASRSQILDIGAGSGRDAAWFARAGHEVTAVEPVEALRGAGVELHSGLGIRWLNDQLPELPKLAAAARTFELILLVGVWQHLRPEEQTRALQILVRLLRPSGRLVISVRHGPGAHSRPCFPADVPRMIDSAQRHGLRLLRRVGAPSIQRENQDAGVRWTWLCWQHD